MLIFFITLITEREGKVKNLCFFMMHHRRERKYVVRSRELFSSCKVKAIVKY